MNGAMRYDMLRKLEVPPVEWQVENMLPLGSAAILAAREKSGKGLICLDLAASVAMGMPFLGRQVIQGPAMYIALEESVRVVRDRAVSLIGDRDDVPLWFSIADGGDSEPFQLDDIDSIQWLRNQIASINLKLVVLDVLREAHGGRENESDDMADLCRPLRQIAHENNTTILVTHHSSKEGGPRGSTSIPAAFDSVYTFTRDEKEDDTQMRGLLVGKGRELPKFAQHIEFDPDTHRWRAIEGAPVSSQPTNIREKVFAVLNGTDEWLTAEEIADRIPDTKIQTVRNALSNITQERYKQLLVKGSGSKGDPRRYHGIHKRDDIDTYASGINPGTNGTYDGPACVDCGMPVATGQLYCPAHGGTAEVVGTGNPIWDGLWEKTA